VTHWRASTVTTSLRNLHPAARALAALVVLGLAVEALHSIAGLGSPRFSYWIEEWVYDFLTATAAAVTLGRAIWRREGRLAWLLLGIGLTLWAAGDVYWTTVLRDQVSPPFPSLDDALYLAGYAFIIAGLVVYARSRVTRLSALVWADVAMAACCVAAIGSSLVLDFVLDHTSGTPAQVAVAVSYPALDLAILAAVASAVAITGWRPGRALTLIAAGLVCAAVSDAVYTYQSLAGTYDGGVWNNFLWPLATVLIAAAALQPTGEPNERELAEDWRAFAASPTFFALAALALLVFERQVLSEPAIAALVLGMLVALIARVALTFEQNHRLVQQLENDPLTGLRNRGKLMYDVDRLFDSPEPAPHVLAILDLDGFKAYNDAFGHPAGDAMLVRLAHQLAAAVGGLGRAYRMGGDEFAMIIPGNLSTASTTLEAASTALSDHGEGFTVTCSRGAVELPAEAGNRAAAIQLADQRMYEDKDSRRKSTGGEVEAVLVRIINQRAPELGAHVDAVKSLSIAVGRDLGLSVGELVALARASELHDIGKIGVPDGILRKRGPLNQAEWTLMRNHTLIGERILSSAPAMAPVARLVRSTHERWDGQGYPDGLAGDGIPLGARVIAVCDAFMAMTQPRPWRSTMTHDAALNELRSCAGSQFEPRLVELFCDQVYGQLYGEDEELVEPDGDVVGAGGASRGAT
jgi:two-component system cell cycle response regulator